LVQPHLWMKRLLWHTEYKILPLARLKHLSLW
jgi:hypothetical protein